MATKKRSTRGATRSANTRPGLPASVLLGSGFIAGVIATVLVFKAVDGDSPRAPSTAAAPKTAKAESKQSEAERPANNTKFDFFTLLPEREVIVPDETPKAEQKIVAPSDDATEKKVEAARPPEKTFQTGEQYTLQAGSFRTNEDAESRRAQILLLALDARVETVEINGERWHRVHVGPFLTHNTLSEARAKLIAEGIDTLVIRRKN